MVLFEVLTHTFQHSWQEIAFASWKKYPNPSRPDIVSIDIIRKEFDPETGILYTRRLISVKSFIPFWLQKIIGCSPFGYFVEEAEIDPRNHRMILKSSNVSFCNIIKVEETCTYTDDSKNKEWTFFRQEAKIQAFPFGFSKKMEEWSAQTFRRNAAQGRQIMEFSIEKIKKEKEESMQKLREEEVHL